MSSKGLIEEKSSSNKGENSVKRKRKVRFIAEISDNNNSDIMLLNDFLGKCNDKEFGDKITWREVLLFFVKKYGSEKNISLIQDESFSTEDKVMMKLKELNLKDGQNLSVYDLAAKVLKIH
ncbi:MAG: hypothetical protein CMK92_06570 [Pseudomonas sp.]|nr:hypothetical protein [Pseudomonas sp.]|tara:strand:- start:173 stop:535 length:363 start_codon:yes stop_codon:yes gene_type:complete